MLVNNSAIDTIDNNPRAYNGIFGRSIGMYDEGNPNSTIIASKNTCVHIKNFALSSCLSFDLLLCIFLFPS